MSKMTFLQQHRFFLLGLLFSIGSLIIFYIIGLNGWGGTISGCYNSECFCEQMCTDSVILEPVNTWTNLFYMLSGLLILWQVEHTRIKTQKTSNNPFEYASFYSILYAFVVIDIGVGSWLFHANLRDYGGIWDMASMNAYMSFLLIYVLTRNFNKSPTWFLSIFLTLTISLIILSDYSVITFSVLVSVCGLYELGSVIWMHKKGSLRGLLRNWKWYAWGFGIFNFGFLIWNLTNTGDIWCNPNTIWQGHGFWHLTTALATYFFYLYLKSEHKV